MGRHPLNLVPSQAINRDLRDIRTVMPGRLKMGTTGQYRQYGGRRYLLDHQVQEFEGRRIGPVQVFQDEQYRLLFGKFEEDGDDGFECFLSLALWRDVEQGIPSFWEQQRE